MRKRHKMSRYHSRKDFSRKSGVHPKNNWDQPLRGGIRL